MILAVDAGCGPGNSTVGLANYFDQVIGIDAGSDMINAAKQMTADNALGLEAKITYNVCPAEDLFTSELLKENSVDMICASAAVRRRDF
jgi:ubiquinone/menaquinone biosynthesis C-methylase UbiE